MKRGLVHIYTGVGKGKTTASVGLAIRAHGYGLKVLFVQFLKNMETGELKVFESLNPEITFLRDMGKAKFTWQMDAVELKATANMQKELFVTACKRAVEDDYDVVILDEVMAAVHAGMIEVNSIARFINERPVSLEVVLTGRNAPKELIDLSDYVSEIKQIKHPYQLGIKARRGIEN